MVIQYGINKYVLHILIKSSKIAIESLSIKLKIENCMRKISDGNALEQKLFNEMAKRNK